MTSGKALPAVDSRAATTLHATMLHMLGFSGRDFRLTDVHGNVVQDIIS